MKTIRRETTAFKKKRKAGRKAAVKGTDFEQAKIVDLNDLLPPGVEARWNDDIGIFRDEEEDFRIECKEHDRPAILKAYEQACRKARAGAIPVALIKKGNQPEGVYLSYKSFRALLIGYYDCIFREE